MGRIMRFLDGGILRVPATARVVQFPTGMLSPNT